MDISERQRQILNFINAFVREKGRPATIREISDAVSISSTSVVKHNLDALQELGLLSRGIYPINSARQSRAAPSRVSQLSLFEGIVAGKRAFS